MTLDERLAEIEALCAKATPGPWEFDGSAYSVEKVRGAGVVNSTATGRPIIDLVYMTDPAVGAANGTLAARSRDLVPRLVAALRLALDTVDDGDPRSPFRDAIAKILAGDGA